MVQEPEGMPIVPTQGPNPYFKSGELKNHVLDGIRMHGAGHGGS